MTGQITDHPDVSNMSRRSIYKARIGEDILIDLPRPRNRIEMSEQPAYNYARHAVLEFLHQRYSNPLDQAA